MRITPTVMENLLTNKICILHTISETDVLTHCTPLQSSGVGDEKNVHLIALSMFIHSLLINGINAAFVIGAL